MRKCFFDIQWDACNDLARTLFMKTSGIDREGSKFERMKKDAAHIRQMLKNRITPRGQYICFDKDEITLSGKKLWAGKQEFACKAFEQLRESSIKGLYIYACSAGDYTLPDEDVLSQVYADIWGTAFTDAIRMLIKKEFESKAKISDSFGPGFFGMPTREVEKIKSLLDFKQLGIEVRDSAIMVPLKSCAGLYFIVDDDYKPINSQCAFCYGTETSCKFCHALTNGDDDDIIK